MLLLVAILKDDPFPGTTCGGMAEAAVPGRWGRRGRGMAEAAVQGGWGKTCTELYFQLFVSNTLVALRSCLPRQGNKRTVSTNFPSCVSCGKLEFVVIFGCGSSVTSLLADNVYTSTAADHLSFQSFLVCRREVYLAPSSS